MFKKGTAIVKKLSSLLLAVVIAVSSLAADEVRKTVYIGAATASIEKESMTEGVFGFGMDKIYSSGMLWGFHSEYSFGKLSDDATNENDMVATIEFDLKAGFVPFRDLSVFALVAAAGQYIENDGAYSFGYGAGMDYALTQNIIFDVRYKTYSMKNSLLDYDYDKAVASLRYKF